MKLPFSKTCFSRNLAAASSVNCFVSATQNHIYYFVNYGMKRKVGKEKVLKKEKKVLKKKNLIKKDVLKDKGIKDHIYFMIIIGIMRRLMYIHQR